MGRVFRSGRHPCANLISLVTQKVELQLHSSKTPFEISDLRLSRRHLPSECSSKPRLNGNNGTPDLGRLGRRGRGSLVCGQRRSKATQHDTVIARVGVSGGISINGLARSCWRSVVLGKVNGRCRRPICLTRRRGRTRRVQIRFAVFACPVPSLRSRPCRFASFSGGVK
eukprot:scaffold307365_cov27-Tisochrysis_lutea.AAC.2